MKKLLLFTFLLFSLVSTAQDAFVRKYTKMYSNKPEKKSECNVNVVFNSEQTDADIIMYFLGGKTFKFYRTQNKIEKGIDKNGESYQLIFCINEEGLKLGLQLYDDDSTLRIIFSDGSIIEFYN